jgi:hypothetical protein
MPKEISEMATVPAAFSRMARDLRFAAAPMNPASTNFQFVINPTNVGANYRLPQAAFWQAPVASDRSHGDMALVGYFVQWVTETNGSVTNFAPKLCRLLIDSTNFQFQKPSDWVNDALIAGNAPANEASGYEGQVAETIIGIWMQPLDPARRSILTMPAMPSTRMESLIPRRGTARCCQWNEYLFLTHSPALCRQALKLPSSPWMPAPPGA